MTRPVLIGVFAIGAGCWLSASCTFDQRAGADVTAYNVPAAPTPVAPMSQTKLFYNNLPPDFEKPGDDAGHLLLKEYGAVFLARNGAVPPAKVVFRDEADVKAFQSSLRISAGTIGGHRIELQEAAMNGLDAAIAEAGKARLSITPRGADSARRSYGHTVTLWASRVVPGLSYWNGKGKISSSEVRRIRSLTPYHQVPEILRLEQDRIFFSKDLSKSIIYSVSPPGTSQHLSMLALDVKEFNEPRVRTILAKHGWFQTIVSDLPHFTYLGVSEKELPGLGLKRVSSSGREFWVPDL